MWSTETPLPSLYVLQYGNEVRLLLPVPDDAASRRKTLWKTIFEGFDRIDGVPTQAEKEVSICYCNSVHMPIETIKVHVSNS